jgi:hypothetical protein
MRAIKLVSMPFALAFLIGAGLLLPGAAQATTPSATLHLSSKLFPTGAAAVDGVSGTIPVSPGGAVKLTAPQYLYEPAVPPATTPSVYEFAFWNANAKLKKTANATFHVPSAGTAFDATAWYLPIGGGCQTVCPPELNTWAFSLTKDEVLPGTPIGKVSPLSAGWTSPSTTVSTATAVKVTALDYFGTFNKFDFTKFNSWFALLGADVHTNGVYLKVPAGESPYAVAFYNQYTTSPPPPPPHQ